MESKRTQSLVVMIVVIGMLVGGTEANFKKCLKKCLIGCAIPPWTAACPAKCAAQCVLSPSTPSSAQTTQRFCTSGCASTRCSNLITKDNYHLDEVEACVNGCSKSCAV